MSLDPSLAMTPGPLPVLPPVRTRRAALVGLAGWWLTLLVAASATGATVTDLGSFVPSGLNTKGVVVGDIVDQNDENFVPHAGIWTNGILTPLPERAGTSQSDALAVSETGRVVGLEYVPGTGDVHAVYWDGVAAPTQIGPLIPGTDFSQAADVDGAGNVVGSTQGGSPHYLVGYYAAAGGSPVPVGVGNLDADKGSSKVGAISGDGSTLLGEVTGTDGADGYYLWSAASPAASGIKLDITPDPSGFWLLAGSVYNLLLIQNDLASDGSVFGFKGTGATRAWYLRTPDGLETEIVGLTAHNAINAKHIVAGSVATGNALDPVHAAVWDARTRTVTDLNSLLPANSGFLLFDALAINDNGDIVGVAAHNNTQVGFLLTTSFAATIAPDPPDPVVGTDFTLAITVSNTLATPLQNVTPPATLTVTGAGKATLKSGPAPATVATLAAGASAVFTYVYRATDKGAIVFSGDVRATGSSGPIVATARCGLGSSPRSSARAATEGTCPADGNGAAVTISTCSIKLATFEETDRGTIFNYDDITLPKLAADSLPPPGSGYPSGGT